MNTSLPIFELNGIESVQLLPLIIENREHLFNIKKENEGVTSSVFTPKLYSPRPNSPRPTYLEPVCESKSKRSKNKLVQDDSYTSFGESVRYQQIDYREEFPLPMILPQTDIRTKYAKLIEKLVNQGDPEQLNISLSKYCSASCSAVIDFVGGKNPYGSQRKEISGGVHSFISYMQTILDSVPDSVLVCGQSFNFGKPINGLKNDPCTPVAIEKNSMVVVDYFFTGKKLFDVVLVNKEVRTLPAKEVPVKVPSLGIEEAALCLQSLAGGFVDFPPPAEKVEPKPKRRRVVSKQPTGPQHACPLSINCDSSKIATADIITDLKVTTIR